MKSYFNFWCKDRNNRRQYKIKRQVFAFHHNIKSHKNTKSSKESLLAAFNVIVDRRISLSEITFRGARQKQLTSYGHEHGEKPIRDDHSLLPYAHGNHACSRDDDCEAEMFFSFFFIIFLINIPKKRA